MKIQKSQESKLFFICIHTNMYDNNTYKHINNEMRMLTDNRITLLSLNFLAEAKGHLANAQD